MNNMDKSLAERVATLEANAANLKEDIDQLYDLFEHHLGENEKSHDALKEAIWNIRTDLKVISVQVVAHVETSKEVLAKLEETTKETKKEASLVKELVTKYKWYVMGFVAAVGVFWEIGKAVLEYIK
jgi:predicted  nucleic acid-binding Zn-ribbon protein